MEQNQFEKKTVGEVVSLDYRTASVFKKHGIDFCCGGDQSISTACKKNNIDPAILWEEVEQTLFENKSSLPYNSWKLPFLIDYIINIYHTYILEKVPQLRAYADKISMVHGDEFPETVELASLFNTLADELLSHMQKEEKILFPYINILCGLREEGSRLAQKPPFGSAANPIRAMEHEHIFAGETMKKIAKLTNSYTPPAGTCSTFSMFYAMLREFEEKLHEHVHLENNILFPKSIKLEEEIL